MTLFESLKVSKLKIVFAKKYDFVSRFLLCSVSTIKAKRRYFTDGLKLIISMLFREGIFLVLMIYNKSEIKLKS